MPIIGLKTKKIIIDIILIIDFELTNGSKRFNLRLHKIFMLIIKKAFLYFCIVIHFISSCLFPSHLN